MDNIASELSVSELDSQNCHSAR